jgi:hypothetical protein
MSYVVSCTTHDERPLNSGMADPRAARMLEAVEESLKFREEAARA